MHENDDLPKDSVNSVADELKNDDSSNGEEVDPDQATAFVDSKEDMFVDAPEDLNFDTPSKESLTTDDDDNGEIILNQSNNEKVDLEKELAVLQEQFKLLTGETDLKVEDGNTVEIISRFSKYLKSSEEERIKHEDALKELRGIISGKDDDIADLTKKISDQEQNEAATDRIMVSLSNVFGQEELQYGSSVSEKLAHLESRVSYLGVKYTEFYYGADQLRKCLYNEGLDLAFQEDFGSALGAACSELLVLKQKEAVFAERLSHLEEENRKLVEQVNIDREMIESVRAEFGKTKAELEQEKTRCANTKEKLSMAVTKGKALVQNRDALKHQISEKTTELENRLAELQETKTTLESSELAKKALEQTLAEKTKEVEECLMKLQTMSTSLDESEFIKGELVKSEAKVASYQEMVSSRSSVIESIESILSQIDTPEESQSSDIIEKVRSLAEASEELKNVSQEYKRLKDLDFSIDLPEEISQSSLETRLTWLKESFLQAKDEVSSLQNQIGSLNMSLSAETEEKNNIRKELDDLTSSLKEMEETVERGSLEREEIVTRFVTRLVKISGVITEGVEDYTSSAIDLLVDRSFDNLEKKIRDSSDNGNGDLFERFQSLIYSSGVELSLCKELLGEEDLASLQLRHLSDELKTVSQELAFVKEGKVALETDLDKSEEKSAMLRDKLSMAIKKGKGLVQDREKLKTQLDEKNSDIEKKMLELQQLTGTVDSYKDQINMLSGDLERTKELEAELIAIKDERDQLKQSSSLNDTLLQKLMKSVETMDFPVDLASDDSSVKVDRLVGYLKEVQMARIEEQEELGKVKEEASTLASKLEETHTALKLVGDALSTAEGNIDRLTEENRQQCARIEEQEVLGKVKEEASSLASKLAETNTALKAVEDALSTAEGNIDRLSEENRQVQAAKENVELELQKAVEEASSLGSELEEVSAMRNNFEAALKQSERNISDIISEKEEAQSRTATAEMELELMREEASNQDSKLTEAHSTLKLLEETLAQTEKKMDSLSKQIEDDNVLATNLKNELENVRNEVDIERNKMADASLTIGSLEEALMKAENSLSALQGEMVRAEVEISSLNSKLNVCMEELAGSSGNSQSKSLEIIPHLDNLQMVLKDGHVISRVNEFLERKFRSLRDMDVITRDIIRNFGDKGLLAEEIDNAEVKSLLSGLDDLVKTELENSQGNVAYEDEISSSLRKIAEGVKLRNNILEKNFEGFSTSIDTLIAGLVENLTAARDGVIKVRDNNESLKEQVKSVEDTVQEQENTISALQKDLSSLMSVCGEAVSELGLEVKNELLHLVQFQENGEETEHPHELLDSECTNRMKELSSATEKACTTLKLFERTSNAAAVVIREMEDRLKEASDVLEKVVLENKDKVSSLEAKVESTEAICQDLKLQFENLKAEAEGKESLIPDSEARVLFDKINGIDVPSLDQMNDLDPHSPYDVRKLYAIVDCVTEMQHQIDDLSYGQKELKSTLAKKELEIQGLKDEVTEADSTTELELVKVKEEFSKLISGLEKLLSILAGNNHVVVDSNFSESSTLLQALEKRIASLVVESEGSKSRAQDFSVKLGGSEKLVDKLSIKVKELEDKLQSKAIQPDVVVHERSIFEAPSTSEISEIEDKGALGKKSISPVPTLAQVRTVRKGSTDHLAINIDSESEHLMNNNETDEDKGHVFKSLNMSGLIPVQGKMIADRVDGIWVLGGRVLMSRPQARLGVIVYSLLLHLWLLASIF